MTLELHLPLPFLLLLLLADVLSDDVFIEPHSTDAIPLSPKVYPGKVALPSEKLSMNAERGFTLKPSDRMSHTVFRRYAQA